MLKGKTGINAGQEGELYFINANVVIPFVTWYKTLPEFSKAAEHITSLYEDLDRNIEIRRAQEEYDVMVKDIGGKQSTIYDAIEDAKNENCAHMASIALTGRIYV